MALAVSTTSVQSCDLVTNRYPHGKAGAGNRIRLNLIAYIVLAFATLCLLMSAPLLAQEDWHYSNVDRIVAVSDVHGAYNALVATLQVADVIDDELSWSGGNTHFVITGDLLDRGPDSRLVMDLIMRLEVEAPQAGGRVHQLLGNHEVMNLIGDLRYVADEEYAAFLDVEVPEEREFWYRQYRQSRPVDIAESKIRSEFDELAPPGYFGHRNAFRRGGRYGRWLLEKPFAIVINDTAFVHGGIPPFVSQHGLDGVNVDLKRDLSEYMRAREFLVDEQVLSPIWQFKQSPSLLADTLESDSDAGEIAVAARAVVDLSESPLHGPDGPTWYRGSALCSPIIEADRLQDALNLIGATRVVLGHTPTIARAVRQRLNGKVIEIDTGMLRSHYEGLGHALVIEDGKLEVVSQSGDTANGVVSDLPQVGFRSSSISEAELEIVLAGARIGSVSAVGPNWKIVSIDDSGRTLYARFRASTSDEGFLPEVAAYRLDRLLGLEMVPVTVRREIAGESGSLQFVPNEALNEMERITSKSGESEHCQLDLQHGAMYVFDALINNNSRSPSSMLYQSGDLDLILTDHDESFGVGYESLSTKVPKELNIGTQWQQTLTALNVRTMRTELGDVLTDHQIEALVERGRLLQALAKD